MTAKIEYILTTTYTPFESEKAEQDEEICPNLNSLKQRIGQRLSDDFSLKDLSVSKRTLEITKEEVLPIADIL